MKPTRTADEGLDRVRELIARFSQNEVYYRSPEYEEASTREHFIDPLFAALGWDVTDNAGLGPLREVLFHRRIQGETSLVGETMWDEELTEEELANREPRVAIPDYAFRTDGVLRFYLEAKRPGVGVEGRAAAYQVKSYAWAERLPVSLLTDFRRLRLFDTRDRPEYRQPLAGLREGWDLKYTDYVDRWQTLWDTLSRDAVAAGSLQRLVGRGRPRGWLRIDDAFLQDLATWRQQLAQDLLNCNSDLDRHALTEATQRILDRLIFLRVVEDRIIEPTLILRRFARITDAYRLLTREFRRLDTHYNGQLFAEHFSERLEVSDRLLQTLIEALYPPKSPYRFNAVSPDILGAVYERFLGSEIVIEAGTARVVEKPEVRHSGGVYYTPEWVVHHIVDSALRPVTEGRSPRAVGQLRILDPACGSGSFLLGALDYLIHWHERYYTRNPAADKKSHYTGPDSQERLTMEAKNRLLTQCIFGLDVDPQAVEVAQMSLYLRILDLETQATLTQQTRMFHGALLPPLRSNILCGNTLLDPSHVPAALLLEDERARRINPFDWRDDKYGFGKILNAQGGFDAIIGNPPYTRVQILKRFRAEESELFVQIYKTASLGSYDISMLFVERCLAFLRPHKRGDKGGRLCFIISRQLAETDAGEPLRELLSHAARVASLVDFADGLVFEGVGAYTLILNVTAASNRAWDLTRVPAPPTADALRAALNSPLLHASLPASELTGEMWTLSLPQEKVLLDRLAREHPTLGEVSGNSIFQGVTTGADKIFRCDDVGPHPSDPKCRLVRPHSLPPSAPAIALEREFLRPVYAGREDLRRFVTRPSKEWLILPYRRAPSGRYALLPLAQLKASAPNLANWLSAHEEQLRARAGVDNVWHGFSYRKNLERFDAAAKIMVPYMVEDLCAAFDPNRNFFVNVSTGGYGVGLDPRFHLDWEYLAALLNCTLLSWALRRYSRAWRGGWFAARKGNLERIPIAVVSQAQQHRVIAAYKDCCDAAERADRSLKHSEKRQFAERMLTARANTFDQVVMETYRLGAEDLSVVISAKAAADEDATSAPETD